MAAAAGIVLAGGRSSRMGTPKATLEWHGSTLLRRVTGIVARATGGPVVVVRAPGQDLPALPKGVEVTEDAEEGRGPLQGLAAGLAAVDGRADVAFVSSTDAPLLHPAFVRRVVGALDGEQDVALPQTGGFPHPLAGASTRPCCSPTRPLRRSTRRWTRCSTSTSRRTIGPRADARRPRWPCAATERCAAAVGRGERRSSSTRPRCRARPQRSTSPSTSTWSRR